MLQTDGTFIVAGTVASKLINPPGAIHTGFGLVRYNPNGSIDTSFGTRGGVLTNFGSNPNATAFALAIQSDGDIIAAGQAGSNLALSRYSSAGKLDTTFGSGGTVTTSLGSNPAAISSLVLQSDGKIVAAGSIFTVPISNTSGTKSFCAADDGVVATARLASLSSRQAMRLAWL